MKNGRSDKIDVITSKMVQIKIKIHQPQSKTSPKIMDGRKNFTTQPKFTHLEFTRIGLMCRSHLKRSINNDFHAAFTDI